MPLGVLGIFLTTTRTIIMNQETKNRQQHRGKGTGGIFKNESGTYRAQIYLPGGSRKTKSFKNKRDAQHWLNNMFAEIDRGLTTDNWKITAGDYAEDWLLARQNSLRPTTWRDYERYIKQWFIPAFGEWKLRDIKTGHITKFYTKQQDAGRGLSSIVYCHRVIRSMFEDAIREGVISSNPAKYAIRPKPETLATTKGMRVLSPEQVHKFLEAAQISNYYVLYQLAIRLGLRQSELLGLTWDCVDFAHKEIKIDKQLRPLAAGSEKRLDLVPTKTDGSKRTLNINGDLEELLAKQLARHEVYFPESKFVFTSSIGTFIDHRNLLRDFKKILELAGLPPIRFHDLRHTAASLMLKNGISVVEVAAILGHSSPAITMSIYAHFIPGVRSVVNETMDKVFKNPDNNTYKHRF
jgi:integrase